MTVGRVVAIAGVTLIAAAFNSAGVYAAQQPPVAPEPRGATESPATQESLVDRASPASESSETLPSDGIRLMVDTGRPLRVALDQRVRVKQAGQAVSGTLVDNVYAHDRIVVPAGSHVLGHIVRLDDPSRMTRLRAMAGGSFAPNRQIVLRFDTVVQADGRQISIRTVVGPVTERVTLRVAATTDNDGSGGASGSDERGGTASNGARKPGGPDDDGDQDDHAGVRDSAKREIAARKHEATQKARETLAAIKQPGKKDRMKAAAIDKLPYHPQYLSQGSVYNAALVDPIDFGVATPVAAASEDARPAPESVLNARLVTGLDSHQSFKGEPVVAVLAEPVFSADHRLILPEGTELKGEVTFVRKARSLHRDGQLRFLFETVVGPDRAASTLQASLYSAQVGEAASIQIDEEGGARATSSKTRFIAPALALVSLRGVFDQEHRRFDGDADDGTTAPVGSAVGARSVGSFFGWGLAGTAIGLVSRPAGVALSVVGACRTVYSAVFGKGRDVTFPAETPIQVQLAPGPAHTP
jgi:type IV secretory pathway VirB10-like protein